MECLFCFGPLIFLGRSGRHEHFECNNCNTQFRNDDNGMTEHDTTVEELYLEIGGEG